ncbi:MAG: hypothetical protein IT348_17300 [Candidatus Eisenbacteria bacterium]|nr:hypothetical protein [Candidatus Eisenbacteria bacterium]
MRNYRIHGLEIESEIPLDAGVGVGSTVDLAVTLGGSDQPALPSTEVAARFGDGDGYSVWRVADGFRLNYPGLADFRVSPTRIEVVAQVASLELTSLLVTGNALTLALLARAELVLHASAVEHQGRVVAFTGSSGMGKSTFAALACATGLQLVGDDVLRVSQSPGGPICHPGSTGLRIRQGAAGVANLMPSWRRRSSIDGRLVLETPAPPTLAALPLRAVIVPGYSDRDAAPVRLRGAEALVELLKHPRVQGWRDPSVLEFLTRRLAELARTVPVYKMNVRRAPPFDFALAEQVGIAVRNA